MKHVLIVDNDHVFTTCMSSILQRENYQVSIAGNGKEAAGQLSSGHFDLVITDALMPYTNGLEVVSAVRNNDANANAHIMVVSEVSNEQSISGWLRAGADAYLAKPLDVSAMLSAIGQLMSERRKVAA